jgi:mycothiol synthase
MLNAVWAEDLTAVDEGRVRELLLAVREADGRPEVDAAGPLPSEFRGGPHLLADVDGELVGYAHLDTAGDLFGRQVGELLVHPAHRRHGYGTALTESIVAKAAAGLDKLRVWAHGDHPAAARIAEREEFARSRELLVLHAEVQDWSAPAPRAGLTLRTFVPGQDEQAVIDVNARAFDWHPEQGSLTVDELRATESEAWFDPRGFFVAVDASDKVVGFHWTKVHPADPKQFGGDPVGEVYVVGVDPGAQGGGLGRALTVAGLEYLRDQGLRQVILYVEGDNTAALALYERLGFTRYAVDVQYGR